MNRIKAGNLVKVTLLICVSQLWIQCNQCPEQSQIAASFEEVKDSVKTELTVPDYGHLPVRNSEGVVQAVVEIPAGTNHKLEYDYENNAFPCDQENGIDRVVSFLSYPGNYGFIPSTLMDKSEGGDGDALDVLILGEHLPTASVQPIIPIGIIQLMDRGEIDDKLIAVPADPKLQTIAVADVAELAEPVKEIISLWFGNYKGPGKMEVQGWLGAEEALTAIDKWTKAD